MAIIAGAHYQCKLFRRLDNQKAWDNIPIEFRAASIYDTTKYRYAIVTGLIAEKADMRLLTAAEIIFKQGDRVEVMGSVYLIESIALLTSGAYSLGADELTPEALQLRFPKILSLEAGS